MLEETSVNFGTFSYGGVCRLSDGNALHLGTVPAQSTRPSRRRCRWWLASLWSMSCAMKPLISGISRMQVCVIHLCVASSLTTRFCITHRQANRRSASPITYLELCLTLLHAQRSGPRSTRMWAATRAMKRPSILQRTRVKVCARVLCFWLEADHIHEHIDCKHRWHGRRFGTALCAGFVYATIISISENFDLLAHNI